MYKIEDIVDKIHCADCLTFIKQMPDNCVDLIFADPDLPRMKDGTINIKESIKFCEILAEQMKRVLKFDKEFFVNTDHRTYLLVFQPLSKEFTMMTDCIVYNYDTRHLWDKEKKVYTTMLDEYLIRGMKSSDPERKFDHLQKTFLALSSRRLAKEVRGFHNSQKPIQLMENILTDSSKENDLILDLFSGGGSMGVACKELKRHFIGIEIDPKHCETARRRILK